MITSNRKLNLGFTLAELLVTVAVIALLLAIVAPIAPTAMSMARQVKCASNQRQIFDAFQVYRNDERFGNQTRTETTAETFHPVDWSTTLYLYLGENQDVFLCPEEELGHRGYPDIRVRIWWLGVRDECLFTHYPYWLESNYEDLEVKPNMWKLNNDDYHRGGKPASELVRYKPGSKPNEYWYCVEDIGDADFWDFDTQVIETPTSIKIHGYEGYADAIHAIIGPKGERYDYQTHVEEIGPLEFFIPRTHFGMNAQATKLLSGTDKLLLIDYDQLLVNTGTHVGQDDGYDQLVRPRHRGKVNALDVSGSVRTYTPDEIDPEGPTTRTGHYWNP
jgi:prepilin-type N-terminal cleavage/methylation domain-containing protein